MDARIAEEKLADVRFCEAKLKAERSFRLKTTPARFRAVKLAVEVS